MNKLALAPVLLLFARGMFIGTGLAARNLHLYYPLIAVLIFALTINILMILWHRRKERYPHK